jgi:putative hydrolase of the HAD superfamily
MPIRALMVDVDGVVLAHPDPRGWSVDLERDLGVSVEALQAWFFEPHFADVIHGRAGLHERLAPVLAKIAPDLTSESLAAYWFEHDYHPDESLLEEIAELRASGLPAHLATVQEHERARYIWETRGLNARFDAIHYAADLGVAKPDPAFFAAIEARTGLASETLAFIDDKAANVEAARRRGWLARVWTGRVRLAELMPELFADR